MKYAAVMCVRKGSKRLPGKNAMLFDGAPLVHWNVMAALGCEKIKAVFVLTDDEAVKEALKGVHCTVIDRKSGNATDEALVDSALREFIALQLEKENEFNGKGLYSPLENIVHIVATNPFATAGMLAEAITMFEAPGVGSVMSVVRQKRNIYVQSEGEIASLYPLTDDTMNRVRLRDQEGFLVENGCFYIRDTRDILISENTSGDFYPCVPYIMPWYSYTEIDTLEDFKLAEFCHKTFPL